MIDNIASCNGLVPSDNKQFTEQRLNQSHLTIWRHYATMCECTFYDNFCACTVYPNTYAHSFVVLCFVVAMQSFIMNSHEVFIHIHQGCFAGTWAIVRLPQCQWSKPDGYGKISQCIPTTKHSKAKTVCIFLGIYCKNDYQFCKKNICICAIKYHKVENGPL